MNPFLSETDDQKKLRWQSYADAFARYSRSLYLFCKEVLGYKDMNAIHAELCEFLQRDAHKFKLILMPRYSFKSSIATVAYTLWRLSLNDSLRILIYSHSNAKAEEFLTEIKNHVLGMKSSSTFRKVYGRWESDPKKGVWNQSAITIQIRKNAHAEPSVDTAGAGTGKVGAHYDIIIFDDLVAKENVTTPEQIQKTKDVYRGALSLLKPGGEVIMPGTRWHFGDLYGQIIAVNKETNVFGIFIRKAILDDVALFADIGLTKQFLEQQKAEQGSYMFSALYQNEPVDDETATFKAKDFAFYEGPQSREEWESIRDSLYVTAYIDPAISQSADADQTAITVCGTDDAKNLYILDIVAGRLLPERTVDELFRLHQKWHIRTLGMEDNAFQKMLKSAVEYRVEEERRADPNFQFFSIQGFTSSSKASKEQRIMGLQPYHERGAIKFPGTCIELLKGPYMDLVYQMLQFPHAPHDDILDSLAGHIPIHRKGGKVETRTIPEGCPAWIERQAYEKELAYNRSVPRWMRKQVAALSLS